MRFFAVSLALGAIITVACSTAEKHEAVAPKDNPRKHALLEAYQEKLSLAKELRDSENGWLVNDRDGMLWTGLYAASPGVDGVNIEAAEDALRPGKFFRCSLDPCKVNPDDPSWSDWSRDMGTGLLAYAWRKKNLALLGRHAAYGEKANWKMGDPDGDFRGVYPPAFVGRLYQTIHALDGQDDPRRLWPDLYPAGLVDYQAHLQVMNIWHRGEVMAARGMDANDESSAHMPDDASGDGMTTTGQSLTQISDTMLDRLKEHADRDPRNPLFAYVLGQYTGDMDAAVNACLDNPDYAGDYVRCDEPQKCTLAAWIFACGGVLKSFGVLND
jgi:hypothetical protein